MTTGQQGAIAIGSPTGQAHDTSFKSSKVLIQYLELRFKNYPYTSELSKFLIKCVAIINIQNLRVTTMLKKVKHLWFTTILILNNFHDSVISS